MLPYLKGFSTPSPAAVSLIRTLETDALDKIATDLSEALRLAVLASELRAGRALAALASRGDA